MTLAMIEFLSLEVGLGPEGMFLFPITHLVLSQKAVCFLLCFAFQILSTVLEITVLKSA